MALFFFSGMCKVITYVFSHTLGARSDHNLIGSEFQTIVFWSNHLFLINCLNDWT